MTHAVTPSVDSIFWLAIQPAIPANAAAMATATIGMEKLPVSFVTRPTAHMANAPAREPQPLSSPIAVDTCLAKPPGPSSGTW